MSGPNYPIQTPMMELTCQFWRALRRSPLFATAVVMTLAVCLGANLTLFAVVDAILLRPLPFPRPEELVTMYNTYPKAGVERDGASFPNYYERRGTIGALSHLALFRAENAVVGDAGDREPMDVLRVTTEFFSTLGVELGAGRSFVEAEMEPGQDSVVVVTDRFWRQRLQADPQALGRRVTVGGVAKTVVGILPAKFVFLSSRAQLFLPLASEPSRRLPAQRHSGVGCELVGRLRPGANLAQLQEQIRADDDARAAEYPNPKLIADAGFRTVVVPLHADHVRSLRPVLWLLQAGVGFLLVLGLANLVNLVLTRASARQREMSIRQFLGAGPGALARLILVETLGLSFLGGALGLVLASLGIRVLGVWGVDQLPLGARLQFDLRLGAVAVTGALVVGVLLALPGIWMHRRTLGRGVAAADSGSRGGTPCAAAQRLRHGFIVVQIAVAFVLLSGAGLLALSLRHALEVSPGFRPAQVLTARALLPDLRYPTSLSRVVFAERTVQALSALPGVAAVGWVDKLPFGGSGGKGAITVQGHVVAPGDSVRGHFWYAVAGDYFTALEIPLRQGRLLEAADSRRADRVCVVDEAFARHYWPGGDAVGRRLAQGSGPWNDADAFTVVGVVGTVKQAELTEGSGQGAVYFPYGRQAEGRMFLAVRTQGDPAVLGPELERMLQRVDPGVPLHDVRPMVARIESSLVARRSPALLVVLFAAVALALAALGTYGVLAFAVAQRHREIGIRLAMGAVPGQIRRLFLLQGARLLGLGLLVGCPLAALTGLSIRSVLFQVSPLSLPLSVVCVLALGIVTLLACVIPMWRASRTDPAVVLRRD